MATVINTFPDRRGGLIGLGLGSAAGSYVASVMQARKKKREEEEQKRKLEVAFDLMGRAKDSEKAQFPTSSSSGSSGTSQSSPQPIRKGIDASRLSPTQGRVPSGQDVGIAFADAGLETKFALTLAQSIDDAKREREETLIQEKSLTDLLGKAGQSEEVLFQALAAAKLPSDVKLGLIPKISDLAKVGAEGAEFIDIPAFQLSNGQEVKVKIPKRLEAATVEQKDAYLQNIIGVSVTTQPQLQTTATERMRAHDLMILGGGEDVEHIMAAQSAGLVKQVVTPQGDVITTNLATQETSIYQSGAMDNNAKRQIQFRKAAIDETLIKLRSIDLEAGVGFYSWMKANIGGFVNNVVGESFLDFMGVEPSEIARAQAARSGFFATLVPFASAIATEEGTRNIITSKHGINIAKEVLLIQKLSTTDKGAAEALSRLTEMFELLSKTFEIQLQQGTRLRPIFVNSKWSESDGRVVGTVGK